MFSAAVAPIAAAFAVTAGLFAAQSTVKHMPEQSGDTSLWTSMTSQYSPDASRGNGSALAAVN